MLRSSKLAQLDRNNMAAFTSNLAQNLMIGSFLLKTTGSGQKMAKTKVVRETPKWRRSEAKD